MALSLLIKIGAAVVTLILGAWGSDLATQGIEDARKRVRTRRGLWALTGLAVVLLIISQRITDQEVATQEVAFRQDAHSQAQAQLDDYEHYLDSKLEPLLKSQKVTAVAEARTTVHTFPASQELSEILNPIHITAQEVTYNPVGGTKIGGSLSLAPYMQVSLNLYVESDVDGSMVHAEALSIVKNVAGYKLQKLNGERVLAVAKKALSGRLARNNDLNPFDVMAREQYWFTISGPVLSLQQFVDFRNKEYLIYFAGIIRIEHGKTASERSFCIMNAGDPEVILECPKT